MLLQITVRTPELSDPLGLLAASHRRHLSRLRSLAANARDTLDPDSALRAEALAELRDGVAWFARASDDPFREEVELLFPQLHAHAPADSELQPALRTLSEDRRHAANLHQVLATEARALLAGGGDVTCVERLADAIGALEELQRAHLDRLEGQIFPRALTALDDAERRSLAEAMLELAPAMVPMHGGSAAALPGLGLP